jgi:hypothetical protein
VKPFGKFVVPLLVVNDTVTGPTEPAGATTPTLVAFVPMIEAFTEPNRTDVVVARLVPVMVTTVPPIVEPVFGAIEVMTGPGAW